MSCASASSIMTWVAFCAAFHHENEPPKVTQRDDTGDEVSLNSDKDCEGTNQLQSHLFLLQL